MVAHTRIGALLQAVGATVIILLLTVSASSTEVLSVKTFRYFSFVVVAKITLCQP